MIGEATNFLKNSSFLSGTSLGCAVELEKGVGLNLRDLIGAHAQPP
jgi:hypothetical protein